MAFRTTSPSWDQFIQMHAKTLWACDFFSKKVWMLGGLVEYFVLFFIQPGTRRVRIAGITATPDGAWIAQQARNLCMFFDELPDRPKYIVCDRDSKFTRQFREILKDDDVKVVQTAVRAPNQNAYAERWAQSLGQECLDQFMIFGEKHLRYLVQEYVRHYNEARPHQSKGNPPLSLDKPPDPVDFFGPEDVVCHEWLGGLLKHYERKTA